MDQSRRGSGRYGNGLMIERGGEGGASKKAINMNERKYLPYTYLTRFRRSLLFISMGEREGEGVRWGRRRGLRRLLVDTN